MDNKTHLICGDCLEIMPMITDKSVDLILCDLPYGITSMDWDSQLPLNKLWEQYERIIKDDGNIVLFSSGNFTIDLINSNRNLYKYKLIWKKNTPTGMNFAKVRPMKYYEEICIFNKNGNHTFNKNVKYKYHPDWVQPSDILEFNTVSNRKGKLHPTQKPVDLCEWLIKTYSNEGGVVLDNCMGSGTTGIACFNTNRKFVGIELDKDYFNIAKERLNIDNG